MYYLYGFLLLIVSEEKNATYFELLPNEILLYLFDYFNGADLFHGFYGLNIRFN